MNGWDIYILNLASSIYWVIGIFIFFTILLHIVFIWWFPLSLKTWKFADYLWLTLALLSTLGLVGEAKQYRAENSHYQSEWQATQSLNNVRNWYTNYQILICAEAKALKEKNLNGTDYHKLCDWLEIRINDLNLMQKDREGQPPLTASLTDGLKQYDNIIPAMEQNILTRRIDRYNEMRIRNEQNNRERERGPLQMIILILAPMMLAFALAIRFTKVTAEFRNFPGAR